MRHWCFLAAVIYLHWTATDYDGIRSGSYHSIIGGDGRVHWLHAYSEDLPAHTYGGNPNSVALSCACMGAIPDPWTQPAHSRSAHQPLRRSRSDRLQLGLAGR